jgi:hypothetical protein
LVPLLAPTPTIRLNDVCVLPVLSCRCCFVDLRTRTGGIHTSTMEVSPHFQSNICVCYATNSGLCVLLALCCPCPCSFVDLRTRTGFSALHYATFWGFLGECAFGLGDEVIVRGCCMLLDSLPKGTLSVCHTTARGGGGAFSSSCNLQPSTWGEYASCTPPPNPLSLANCCVSTSHFEPWSSDAPHIFAFASVPLVPFQYGMSTAVTWQTLQTD